MARPSGTAPNFASPKGEGFQPSPKGTLINMPNQEMIDP